MGNPHKNKIEWHTSALPRATEKALRYVADQTWLRHTRWYLAGGTALALSFGHRTSYDLDFFTAAPDFSAPALLKHLPKSHWIADTVEEGTIFGRLLKVKVSFIAYPFFKPKEAYLRFGEVRFLDPRDIAVMKIIATSQRGRKRDFVDLFWYTKNQEPLADVLRRLPSQYPTVAHDYQHILKSLVYFVDAEDDPMPELHFRATWREMKAHFQKEVPKITREFLSLS